MQEPVPLRSLDRAAIQRLIPHRDPFLLVDRAEDLVPGISAVGLKIFRPEDPMLARTFPGWDVVPAMLILEAIAQTAMLVAATAADRPLRVFLRAVPKARFHRPVRCGEEVRMFCRCRGRRGSTWQADTVARVNGAVVAQAALTALLME